MKRCICNTEPTVTCAGMKYYVSCPKCGLATDMYDTLEDAEKAWDSRRVEMGKYVLKVVEEKKAIEKKKEEEPKEDKVVPKEEPKEVAPKLCPRKSRDRTRSVQGRRSKWRVESYMGVQSFIMTQTLLILPMLLRF